MYSDLTKIKNIIDGQKQFPSLKKHYMDKVDYWTFTGWKEDEVGSYLHKGDIIDKVEKLEMELYNDIQNGKNTAPRPTYIETKANILTLIGLTESAKRDTGEVSTTLDWISVGTSATAETENDTDLIAEDSGGSYARKQLSTLGTRKVYNQTAKYGVLWDDGDVSTVPISLRESGLHWHASAANKCHARVTFTTFTFNSGDLFVVQINELHEHGSV